jgi:murein DD-endopeptidase MepM/ murein hydrolase activator NlpD
MKRMLVMLFLLFYLNFPSGLTTSVGEISKINDITAVLKTIKRNKVIDKILMQIGERDSIAYQIRDNIPIYAPIKPRDIQKISSDYGWRKHPILLIKLRHHGIDVMAPLGTKVNSTADGLVIKAEKSRYGYGNEVIIKHSNNYETRYAHLDSFSVQIGQKVKLGTLIGTVGVTGLTTGPHLHYEILKNNKDVDPMFFTYIDKKDRSAINYISILNTLELI